MTRFLHEKATDCLVGEKKVLGYIKAGEESSGLIESSEPSGKVAD